MDTDSDQRAKMLENGSSAPIVTLEMDEVEKKPTAWQRFKRFIVSSRNWIGVFLARLMFFAVAMVCMVLAISTMDRTCKWIYMLFCTGVLLIIEPIVTLSFKGNREWKWTTPCIYAFILCTVPSIWIIEHKSYENRIAQASGTFHTPCEHGIEDVGEGFGNLTVGAVSDMSQIAESTTAAAHKLCLCFDCAPYMEQAMLFALIIGRWFLPKSAGITSDQKAQLLLVNIAVASDILEVYELMKEDLVKTDFHKIIIVLSVWTLSLFQFGIVSTATSKTNNCCYGCFKSEMWSLVTLLMLDDLSFLVLRLTFAIRYSIISYSSIFFIAKNVLVLIMDINRVISLHNESRKERKNPDSVTRRHLSHVRR